MKITTANSYNRLVSMGNYQLEFATFDKQLASSELGLVLLI